MIKTKDLIELIGEQSLPDIPENPHIRKYKDEIIKRLRELDELKSGQILKNQPTITKRDIECWADEAMDRIEHNRGYRGDRYIEECMAEMLTEAGVSITVDPHGKSGK